MEPHHFAALSRRHRPRAAPRRSGQVDPRVTIENANEMVKALRQAKREVVYVVYPDEGHGFARPENQRDFYGRIEEFLAKYLGGRAEPWKKIEGATAEVR
jgi:acetyl esterase/lipase